MRLMRLYAGLLLAFCLMSLPLSAQTWPSRPIRLIVPYAAGGATDVFARLVAGKLQEQLGTPVIVENRAGAGGNIGADAVAKATPDGYTLLFNINGHAIAPAIYKSLPFDPDKDFLPITQLVSTATAFVAAPTLPVKNFAEFVALAKARPGALNYGSTGIGNSLHLTMELVMRDTGIAMTQVPFRGDAPLIQAFMSGDIHAAVIPTAAARPQMDSGVVKALGVTSAKRVGSMSDVPTLAEQGLPDFAVSGWMGLFAPAGTPRPIIERVAQEARIAMASPDMAPRLASFGVEAAAFGPEAFGELYKADRAKFQRIVKEANIALQD